MVTLLGQTPCFNCGYLYKTVRISTVRINKNSLREYGTSITMTGPRGAIGFPSMPSGCPECGQHDRTSSVVMPEFRLSPEDAEAVRAYRDRRWPR